MSNSSKVADHCIPYSFSETGTQGDISVIYCRIKKQLQWQGLVHIIQYCSRGSPAVVYIIEDVLKTIKKDHPEVSTAYFRKKIMPDVTTPRQLHHAR